MKRGLTIILTITLSPLAGWTAGAWHAHSSSASARTSPHSSATSTAPAPASSVTIPDYLSTLPSDVADQMPSPAGQEQDLFGNDVSPAVAGYLLDRTGTVYEEHSPETEVGRLNAPTT